jgi:hypothetical protein
MRTVGSITTRSSLIVGAAALVLGACAGKHVSPLAPPPYRAEVAAVYETTWAAIVKALARQNVPLRAIARDSGVIASDEFVTPIGVYADCGTIGDDRIEGEAIVSYTLFASPNGDGTRVQINAKMRTQAHRKGPSGKLKPAPVYQCASTARFEANLVDAIRELVKE